MAKVHILPKSLIRLIAAGEVIERPASVVKELVENSLDARASAVHIDLWGAGRTRVRVSDNGEGMTLEDALAALERHATSKLTDFKDLEALATFGFRGEALPSIAAVSRLELTTRTQEAPEGWTLKLEGGKLVSKTVSGSPAGTTLDVQDLFFNTPARAKFLKRDSTERLHVLKTLQEMALAHPSVRFELSMDGKTMMQLVPTQELGERLSELWGIEAAQSLVPVNVTKGPCTIKGFVSALSAHHATRAYQALFINQRPVQQRAINHAIYEAFREWLPVGRHPVYCLFVELDPALVDVNVHPTKREVRISDERALYDLVFTSIRSLFKADAPAVPSSRSGNASSAIDPNKGRWLRSPDTWRTRQDSTPALPLALGLKAPPALQDITSRTEFTQLRYLGQFQKLYLLFEQGEELILIDQHAACERVLYERILAQVTSGHVARQALLAPLLWDVSAAQAELIRSYQQELEKMGFLLESFGPSTFALKEWPVVLPETQHAKRFLEEVLEKFEGERPQTVADIQHQIAASAACRASIMANDSVSPEEVSRLVEDLSACERPMTCPHGRPTHIRMPIRDFHNRFRRT